MNPEADPYAILGVSRDCNADELKSAYRRLARENHPDIALDKGVATLRMTQINAAWALVGDPHKRASFDARWRLDEHDRQRLAAQSSARERNVPKSTPPPNVSKPRTPATSSVRSSRPPSSKSPSPRVTGARPSPHRSGGSPASRHARLAEASSLLFKQNKPNEALEICKSILKTDFRNIPARELMGEAYLRLGQTDRALAVWEQALVLSPSNVMLRKRWLSLMPPEARATHERKGSTVAPAVPRAPMSHPTPQSSSNLLSRLVSRLKKK